MSIKEENKIIRFIKTSITFFLGNVLSKLVAFLLIPIYTKYLTPSEFGSYDLVITIIGLLVPLVYAQIWDGVFRFAFDNEDLEEKNKVITNGFMIMGICTILYLIIGVIINQLKSDTFSILSLMYGMMLAMQYQYTVISRVYLNNFIFSLSGVINTLVTAILNIVMIINFGFGIESLYISSIIGIVIQILMIELVFKSIKNFNIKYLELNLIKLLIRFSLPLSISTISYWLLSGFTKIWISVNLDISANGLYAIANKFSGLILLAVGVIQFAWNEMIYIAANNKESNLMYQNGIRFAFKVTMLSSSLIIFISKLIFPILVDNQYLDAINLIPITIVGVVANSFASFTATIFLANKKSSTVFITTILAVIANLTLSLSISESLDKILICLMIAFIILATSRIFALYKYYSIKLDKSSLISLIIFIFSCIFYKFARTREEIIILIVIYLIISFILAKRDIKKVIINITKKV